MTVLCDSEKYRNLKCKECILPCVRAATTWQRLTSTCCFKQEPTDSQGLVDSLRVKLQLFSERCPQNVSFFQYVFHILYLYA